MPSDIDDLDKEFADIEPGDRPAPPRDGNGGKRPSGGKGKTLPIAVATVALVAFGGIVWYAYNQGVRSGSEDAAPLLTPDGPAKVLPDDPGGMDVPHQDKLVYDQVEPSGRDDEKVERLLPPPEDPMRPPVEEQAKQADQEPVTSEQATAQAESQAQAQAQTEAQAKAAEAKQPEAPAPEADLAAPKTPPPTVPAAKEKPAEPEKKAPEPAKTEVAKADVGKAPSIKDTWRIQIAAVKDEDAAKKEWERRQNQFGDLLGKLTLEVQRVDIEGKGTFFRIRGGPLADKKAADDLCAALKKQGLGCLVVKPGA